MKKIILFTLFLGLTFTGYAQRINGVVVDNHKEPFPGANVTVKGTNQGTITDFDGRFTINIKKFPVTIVISAVGYKTQKTTLKGPKTLKIILQEDNEFLDDVVVTASRNEEKIKESPVSIERMSLKEIQRSTAPSFYGDLSNLKGVTLNTNSLTFQSVNMRGYTSFTNTSFLQLIDGMDNSSPALNFPMGNLAGINELDAQSLELLPGAASALYGANAFNGVLNMRTKNPFSYKGLSAYVKYGITTQNAAGSNPYSDVGVRYAWGGDHVAAKLNFSLLKGTDWYAVDETDIDMNNFNESLKGSRETNPSYDGMNIYGDEIATVLPLNSATGGLLDDIRVSRTGYAEKDLADYKAKSLKADLAVHYRPSGRPGKLEFIWNSRFGTGQTIVQGLNRYVFDGILIHQHKLEIKSQNWFIRGYYTGEDAGNSYDTKFTAWNINRKWRSDRDWFIDYARVYINARLGGADDATAHQTAREFADNSPVDSFGNPKSPRFQPGSEEFKQAFNEVINDTDFKTGGRFVDKSNLKHVEANYNFKNLIKFAEIQVGGSLRRYSLHSDGSIFTDYPDLSPISIDESGAYIQISKKMMNNRLKLSTSLRYDKQVNFDGNFSPRFSAVYSAGENKRHNFRMSFQTGFRNPTTQDLYIGVNLGPFTIVGGSPDNWDRYQETIIAHDPNSGTDFPATITGRDAYTNSYTLNSFIKFAQTHDPNDLVVANVEKIKPEQVSTIEFGYRGRLLNHLGVDMAAYYSEYNSFIAGKRVVALSSEVGTVDNITNAMPAIGSGAYKVFFTSTNIKTNFLSYGADIGFNYKAGKYMIGLIYDYTKFTFTPAEGEEYIDPSFNTPEHRIKASLANDDLYKGFGFSINYKYQTEFMWHSSSAKYMLPERNILDAQISYNIKEYKTRIKIGGSNVLGEEYLPAPGTGKIGRILYVGLTYGN